MKKQGITDALLEKQPEINVSKIFEIKLQSIPAKWFESYWKNEYGNSTLGCRLYIFRMWF